MQPYLENFAEIWDRAFSGTQFSKLCWSSFVGQKINFCVN